MKWPFLTYLLLFHALAYTQPFPTLFEIPETDSTSFPIFHTGYTFLYADEHEQALWVAYELTRAEASNIFKRKNDFRPDPKVTTHTANNADYKDSGFDRGHLAPSADMGWSPQVQSESFYYSNISPQHPSFNRVVWQRLETQVRNWAMEYDTIYIVTGPILREGLTTIGPNAVSVPEYFYKAILHYSPTDPKGIGFIMPNAGSSDHISHFVVSIDSLETLTGLNFFPLLPDHQAHLESDVCIPCWTWSTSQTHNSKPQSAFNSSAIQCLGTTAAGNRCRLKTTNPEGYCHHHIAQLSNAPNHTPSKPISTSTAVQCTGITQKGLRCKRMTRSETQRCHSH